MRIAPITLLYGANGAGKSSLIYALLALRNILTNPNQATSGFFNLGFVNLGDFEAIVHDHDRAQTMSIGLTTSPAGDVVVSHEVKLTEVAGEFALRASTTARRNSIVDLGLSVSFPYPANSSTRSVARHDGVELQVVWNGITGQITSEVNAPDVAKAANRLAMFLNSPAETIRQTVAIPFNRGFTKPHYSVVPLGPVIQTEDEVATQLQSNKYMETKLAFHLRRLLRRDLRTHVQAGTSIFSIDTTDEATGLACEVVNDGFGVNQMVYLLARCLQPGARLICIEEPETHLHPSAVRALSKTIVEIGQQENRSFVISTHSEVLVMAMLSLVASGVLPKSSLACYHARKEARTTIFDPQVVSADGQITGGLSSFMESELADIRDFLKATGGDS